MHDNDQSEILPLIRAQVRDRLTKSAAFMAMPPEQRAQVAHDTVNALNYIVGGAHGTEVPGTINLGGNAEAFAGPVGRRIAPANVALKAVPAAKPDKPKTFTGQAGQDYADTVAAINFPAFVGGLIDGVFNSIVTSSIKQMEAYAEMVKNVSKSVDQYMKDNVTEGHARDYLAEKYPDHLELGNDDDNKVVLKPKEGADDGNLPDFFADLGLKNKVSSLDEDTVEQELVPAARRRIAMDRQQLLATMVMMGVNRLVVTNGTIEASCFFELDTTDTRKRSDRRNTESEAGWGGHSEGGAGWEGNVSGKSSNKWDYKNDDFSAGAEASSNYDSKANWYSKTSSDSSAKFRMTTASTRDSEQTVKMHAELGGKVKVNFKSDYFPMEKMVDALQVNQIRDKTAAGIAPQPAAPAVPALPAPALPALPPMPTAPPPAAAPAPAAK